MKRFGLGVATALLVASLVVEVAGATGPDFTGCAEAGEAFGECVAGIAREFRGSNDDAETGESAKDLVTSCAAFDGEQFGACVAEAVRGQHERGDAPGAAVSEAARALVDGCRDLQGREFGQCVRAGAHELGHGADQQHDETQDTDSGKPAHEKKPKHQPDSGESGEVDGGTKPPHTEKPAHSGKPASASGHGSGGRKP